MIERPLLPHPSTPAGWVDDFRVRLHPRPDTIEIEFVLYGDLARLRLPAAAAGRQDGLWHHTCCELFVGLDTGPAYREWNLSPSGAWQAYDFEAYRRGCRLAFVPPPAIASHDTAHALTLAATVPVATPAGPSQLRLGVAAVLEDRDGLLSYWALGHAAGRPDFHHPASFILTCAPNP